MQIISIINHKGGTGKTTTCLNLASALSLLGKKILIIDNDPQYNLTQSFLYDECKENIYNVYKFQESIRKNILKINTIDLVPTNLELSKLEYELQAAPYGGFKLKKALRDIDDYDYVLIDCAPSLGILTMNALIASTKVIIVAESDYYSIRAIQTIKDLIDETVDIDPNSKLKLEGILITRMKKSSFKKEIIEELRKFYPVYDIFIRDNIALSEAPSQRKSIFEYNAKSNGAEDYMQFAKEFLMKQEATINI